MYATVLLFVLIGVGLLYYWYYVRGKNGFNPHWTFYTKSYNFSNPFKKGESQKDLELDSKYYRMAFQLYRFMVDNPNSITQYDKEMIDKITERSNCVGVYGMYGVHIDQMISRYGLQNLWQFNE